MSEARISIVGDALRRSLEQSSVILQHIADGVTAQDASGRVVYANDAALRLLGVDARADLDTGDAPSLLPRFEMLDEDGRPFALDKLPGRLVLGGAPEASATIRWRRRGAREERWTVVRARPVRDDAGNVILAINILNDITERRRAEQRMTLINRAGTILSALGDYQALLPQVAQLLLPDIGECCVIEVSDGGEQRRFVTHAEPTHAIVTTLRAHATPLLTDEHAAQTKPLMHQLGLRASVSAPLIARGRSLGTLALLASAPDRFGADDLQLVTDLAQRMALAIDNAQVLREARSAAEVRKDLVAVVAHDLKNPLNAIGMATLLLGKATDAGADPERIKRQLAIVQRATDRMTRLIHDLLDVSAIDAGALQMEPASVSVQHLLIDAYEAMAGLAQDKQLTLERELPSEELRVTGDRERLLQVLSNLIGNAIKFTPAGGRVTLAASRLAEAAQFRVADTGCGIEAEHLPHVFDRYWRVRRQQREGTGLGLSIVKGIVEAHGGAVAVHTVVGQGSSFAFTLPLG